ncbi:MAG: putative rRNA maturation factor [Phycisphaerales bacterium]|jgi:probable rRNA maturation factor
MDEPDQPEPLSSLAAPPLSAEILDPSDLLKPSQMAWLSDAAARVLAIAADRFSVHGQVRARVVNDEAMSAAHLQYSNIAGTTDVLTFDLSESECEIDADLFVCVDEAGRRAAEMGHEPERELLLYVVHGLLHCLGHDDHDPEAYAVMHALEDELLSAAGIGATFHADAKGAREGPDG